MSWACCRGCFYCGAQGEGQVHSTGCCGSTICCPSLWRQQTEKWLEAETKYKAEQPAERLEALRVAVTTVALELAARKQREEVNAQDELRQLVRDQEQEQVAEQTREMIEARLALLRDRQANEPEPERLKEQTPKVVHVPATPAKPQVRVHQKAT